MFDQLSSPRPAAARCEVGGRGGGDLIEAVGPSNAGPCKGLAFLCMALVNEKERLLGFLVFTPFLHEETHVAQERLRCLGFLSVTHFIV